MPGFFKDKKGNCSMMRLIMFISFFFSMGLTIWVCYIDKPADYIMLIFAWLGIATTGKLVQKFAEKNDKNLL